jgi:hypothetical protein
MGPKRGTAVSQDHHWAIHRALLQVKLKVGYLEYDESQAAVRECHQMARKLEATVSLVETGQTALQLVLSQVCGGVRVRLPME